MRYLPQHGLVFDGHDTPRTELLTAAREHLIAGGTHSLDADEQLANVKIARTWWGGDDRGFVQEDHDGATPVCVIHVHAPEQVA